MPPVRLDPFRRIVGVHWSGDVMLYLSAQYINGTNNGATEKPRKPTIKVSGEDMKITDIIALNPWTDIHYMAEEYICMDAHGNLVRADLGKWYDCAQYNWVYAIEAPKGTAKCTLTFTYPENDWWPPGPYWPPQTAKGVPMGLGDTAFSIGWLGFPQAVWDKKIERKLFFEPSGNLGYTSAVGLGVYDKYSDPDGFKNSDSPLIIVPGKLPGRFGS